MGKKKIVRNATAPFALFSASAKAMAHTSVSGTLISA